MADRRLGFVLALGACVACTVSNDGSGFTSAGSSVSVSVGTTVPTDESDSGGSSSGTGGSTDEGTSTGGDETAGSGSTTAATSETGTTGAVDPTDGQPADGMYSMCLQGMDCGNMPNLCIQSVDADMNPIDGFCSTTGCSNPAMDCDPAPGGTAVPVCVPITVNAMAQMACALNCQGLVCPTGMMCVNFTDLGMICM